MALAETQQAHSPGAVIPPTAAANDQAARESIFKIYLEQHTKPDVNGHTYLNLDPAAFNSLCRDLSAPRVSENMTGAEIEAAVGEALYAAYDADRIKPQYDKFTSQLITQVVTVAKGRALYVPDGDALIGLTELRKTAAKNHWVSIP
jgi:SpoVK/Ycf46/Vps4 family AAA+-type ATPase